MAIKIRENTDADVAQSVERPPSKREVEGSKPSVRSSSGSSKGKTAEFDSANGGSNPSPEAIPSRTFRTRAPNNTFDRKAYMAEYMRQYNAKKKAKKQNDVD